MEGISKFCREHGIKYRELAVMVGVSVRTVEAWAQGKPMSRTAAIVLGIVVDKIKQDTNSTNTISRGENERLQR